jgi:aspartate/methionine/tyrosine aminotransferase
MRRAAVSRSRRLAYVGSMSFPPLARPEVQNLRMSKIREVANAGLGRDDILAFWFGESDQPTPDFIRQPAAQAMLDG